MAETASRRGRPRDDELTARRTEEILDASAALFAARGYRNTDVQVVADELGIGKGTIYRYFPTKRELFLAAVDRAMRRVTARIDASMTAPDALAQVEQAIRAYLTFFDENPEVVELLIQERAEFKDRPQPTYFEHRDASTPKWEVVVSGLIAAGRIRPMAVNTILNVMGDLVYGTMFTNYFSGRQRSVGQQAEEILEVVLAGLLTDDERGRWLARRGGPGDSVDAGGAGDKGDGLRAER